MSKYLLLLSTIFNCTLGSSDVLKVDPWDINKKVEVTSEVKDTLLIVLSARLVGNTLSQVAEAATGLYLYNIFKSKYRKIIIWKESVSQDVESKRGPSALEALKESVDLKLDGEYLDIFAVDHGPNISILPGIEQAEAESILPKNYLRRFFSTACSQWGRIKNANGSTYATYVSSFSRHLSRLGISEYMIYANDNMNWGPAIFSLASCFAKGGSWIESGIQEQRAIDKWVLQIQFGKLSKIKPIQALVKKVPLSRPVFGGNQLYKIRAQISQYPFYRYFGEEFEDWILLVD